MMAINLLSAERVARARRRGKRRAWAGVLLGHASLVGLALLVVARLEAPPDDSLRSIARAQDNLAQKDREKAAIAGELASLRSRIELSDRVTDHPRAGSLLALLARAIAPEGVLDRVEIGSKSVGLAGDKKDTRLREGYVVTLSGYAGSRAGVSRFIEGLEKVGVFDSVTPIETRATTFGPNSTEVVSFSVALTLSEEGRAK